MESSIPDVIWDPGMDRVFEALFTRRRRMILFMLKQSSPRPIVDFLPRSAGARNTETELRHDDLPRLASLAYIDWDRAADEVSRGQRFDEIEPMLELFENHADELPDDWPQR
nr:MULTISPECIES: hypothetical protein [unclassified Haloarcula]